ncbi:MAG: hypothetical protein HYS13_25685 [Planctomycetia bacterium]|nr:hypothetical protein [Planctomycetia bacterium]
MQRDVPLVWSDGSITRVLDTSLSAEAKTLVVLFHSHPDAMTDVGLQQAVEYSAIRKYKANVLRPLHRHAKVDYRDSLVRLLPPGIQAAVEIAKSSRAGNTPRDPSAAGLSVGQVA